MKILILLFAFASFSALGSDRAALFEVGYKIGNGAQSGFIYGVRMDVDNYQFSGNLGDGLELGFGHTSVNKRAVTYIPGIVYNFNTGFALSNRFEYRKRDSSAALGMNLGRNIEVVGYVGTSGDELIKDNAIKSH